MVPREPPRAFVFVADWVFAQYHEDRQRMYRDWPPFPADRDLWDVHAMMRRAAMKNLREEVIQSLRQGNGGPFPIPV